MRVCKPTVLLLVALSFTVKRSDAQFPVFLRQSAASTIAAGPQGSIYSAKEAKIRQLMEIIGFRKNVVNFLQSMSQEFQSSLAQDLPPGEYRKPLANLTWLRFQAKVTPQDFIDLAVPLYNKYFSDDDVEGLLKYNELPVAQKLATLAPQLFKESFDRGANLVGKLYLDSVQEILAEHPEMAPAFGVNVQAVHAPPSPDPSPSTSSSVGIDPRKEAAIRRLATLTTTKEMWATFKESMSGLLRSNLETSLPAGDQKQAAVNLLHAKFESNLNLDLLVPLVIPVYDKYFSQDEIDVLVTFNEGPLAQKLQSVGPALLAQGLAEFSKLGAKLASDAFNEVLVEHPDLAEAYEKARKAAQ